MICEPINGLSTTGGVLRTAQFSAFDYNNYGTTVPLGFITESGYFDIRAYRAAYGNESQYVLRCTLSNGNKIMCRGVDSGYGGYSLYFRITDANNVTLYDATFGTRDNYNDLHYALFLKNNDAIYLTNCIKSRDGNSLELENYTLLDISSYLGEIPPSYIWTAWNQISGNGGQYRCNLTKINGGVIENISTHYQRNSDSFSRISQQSSIMNIIQNSALDVERPIAYSGNAKLTLEVKAGTQSVSRKLVYRFYEPDGTTPLYSLEQVIYLTGTTPTNDVLLMFVHDDTEQVAAFLPVEKVNYQCGNDQYIFGDVSPTETEMLYIWLWLQMSSAGEPEYPYDTGSTDNGGDPTGNIGGDHIPTPALPTLGGMSSGFFTVYCPTESQLAAIAQYLWTDNVITNIRKYFTNFSDNIIALYVLPYKSTSLPFKNFKVGNMEAQDIANVEYITARFVDIDMGSVYVENEYDSYLDYSPYTKFDCFLPAIGVVSLDADDIMCVTDPDTGVLSSVKGSTVSLKYTLDLMTGNVVAFITINGEMRYQFSGKVGYNIPLTGENYSGMATGFVTAVAGLVGTIATGGMTAPMSASAAVAGTINAMKPEIHRGGNLTGDASLLGGRTPYLIYRRPNKPLLEKQGIFTGFPSYKSGKLTNFTGYTEVIDAHVEGISCTETERAEILTLLKSGVII